MRYNENGRRGRAFPRLALLTGVLLLPLAACDTEALLQVEDPDIVTPESLTKAGEQGRTALYAGAIGEFAQAWDGSAGGGSFTDGIVTTSAYMADEAYLAGTFPTRTEFDQRSIDIRNGTLAGVFRRLQFARRATEDAVETLRAAKPADPRIAELLGLAGYTYIGFGENFCSGVPFSKAPAQGELEFGEPQTTEQIFTRAIERFDAVLAESGASAATKNLARVGKARALLNLARYAEAAQVAAEVPDGFVYLLTHSTSSGRQENGFFAANSETLRLSIANNEGGGLPFKGTAAQGEGIAFLDEEDPRVPYRFVKNAFDASVPPMHAAAGTYILQAYGGFAIPTGRAAPSPLASGLEARLIEAEAALRQDRTSEWLRILNDLRANSGLALAPLADPGSPEARVALTFKERAYWLFATGHRLGDLRRLVRQYGLSEDQAFPSGPYFKGGSYGDDMNLPIPFDEQNNPHFNACLDRNA